MGAASSGSVAPTLTSDWNNRDWITNSTASNLCAVTDDGKNTACVSSDDSEGVTGTDAVWPQSDMPTDCVYTDKKWTFCTPASESCYLPEAQILAQHVKNKVVSWTTPGGKSAGVSLDFLKFSVCKSRIRDKEDCTKGP